MHRRAFLFRSGGLAISVAAGLTPVGAANSATDRVGMGTVIFRSRFEQTRSKSITELKDPLKLLNVPAYYRQRFGSCLATKRIPAWVHGGSWANVCTAEKRWNAALRQRSQK
jgi:hypothetical protein